MEDIKLTKQDVEILNSKRGIRNLLSSSKTDLRKALKNAKY